MDISYNSDYRMTFHDHASCDLHQMSELILALERDIPKWRHIWMADEKLRKEKAKIGERLVSSLQQFRYDWMSEEGQNDEKRIERFRIKYYFSSFRFCSSLLRSRSSRFFLHPSTKSVKSVYHCSIGASMCRVLHSSSISASVFLFSQKGLSLSRHILHACRL